MVWELTGPHNVLEQVIVMLLALAGECVASDILMCPLMCCCACAMCCLLCAQVHHSCCAAPMPEPLSDSVLAVAYELS